MLAKPQRHRCPAHLRWVATLPCIVCTRGAVDPEAGGAGEVVSQAHHLTIAQPKGRGIKAGDQYAVPLCPEHHGPGIPGSLHSAGNERDWWWERGIDPITNADRLWAASVAVGRVRGI